MPPLPKKKNQNEEDAENPAEIETQYAHQEPMIR